MLSVLTLAVSSFGLVAYGINTLLKKAKLPNFPFTFPVFKILLTLVIASFIILVGSSFTAGSLGLLAADENDEESINTIISDEEEIEEVMAEEENSEDEAKKKVDSEENKKTTSDSETYAPLKAHFIDVGQADAALIEYEDRAILIDAGDWNKDEVVSYLRQEGIERIDLLIGSHEHADHIGQMDRVINNFPVDEVWLPGNGATSQVFERVLTAIEEHDINYDEPRAGDEYKLDNLHIDIVSPHNLTGDLNNDSIVMKLTYGAISFLFTGDAEKEAESRIVHSDKNIHATILKVGHHGSDTSTTDHFLHQVNPKVAIISVGKNSQYGHPNKSVLDRIQKQGADLYATSTHGNIIVTTDGTEYEVATNKNGTVTAGSKRSSSQSSSRTKSGQSPSKKSKQLTTGCIDINKATTFELQGIIHIGEARAEQIIDQRPFKSVDELTKINGIADKRLADIKTEGKACVK